MTPEVMVTVTDPKVSWPHLLPSYSLLCSQSPAFNRKLRSCYPCSQFCGDSPLTGPPWPLPTLPLVPPR